MEGYPDSQQTADIAVLRTDIDYIKEHVRKITDQLELLEKNYVKRSEMEKKEAEADGIHKDLATSIQTIELDLAVFKTQIKTWGAAAVLTLGMIQFFISLLFK